MKQFSLVRTRAVDQFSSFEMDSNGLQDKVVDRQFNWSPVLPVSEKGTLPSVNLGFELDIRRFVELSETSKTVEWLLPLDIRSRVMALLLNFRPIFRY